MSCGKVCEKLWTNYLNKYGDFRERSRIIRNDRQCFQLPRIKQQSSYSTSKHIFIGNNEKISKKCDSLLPLNCCHSSIINSFLLNKSEQDKLEKLIEAENFPENIFSEAQFSIDNKIDLHQLTSPINSIFNKTDGKNFSSSRKSELITSSHDLTTSRRITNPYTEYIRKTEKSNNQNSDTKTIHQSFDSPIDKNIHNHIQKFLSFLYSLDDNIDHKFNEQTLLALFSVDNHLSSSIYIPMNIQQLNIVPKPILNSLKNTSENEYILNQIENEISKKNSHFQNNIKQKQVYLNDDLQTSHSINQDNELNSKLLNTYIIKAFKDFLIQQNKSTRLPKLFHDLDRN